MAKRPPTQLFSSRIVGESDVDPATLTANPLNWRRHPKCQQDALEGMLKEVGWVQRVVVNKTTGNIIDGHMRVQLAVDRKEKYVPVVWVELTEAEEAKVLTALDPLGDMAVRDQAMLDSLLSMIETEDAGLASLFDGLHAPEVELGSNNLEEAWAGMPAFRQESIESHRHIIVHFRNAEDVKAFFALIGQQDSGKTKSIWYPERTEQIEDASNRY